MHDSGYLISPSAVKRIAALGALGAVALAVSLGPHFLIPHWAWKNEVLHAAMEGFGASIALAVALMLLSERQEKEKENRLPIAMGFLTMGILDAFHAMVLPGHGFVLLHSASVMAGGCWFAAVWLPGSFSAAINRRWVPWSVGACAVAFGIWTICFRETMPAMVQNGEFTLFAKVINSLGGVLFLAAALRIVTGMAHFNNRKGLIAFASVGLLLGTAGITFYLSAIWGLQWWLWHLLRLAGFGVALWYMFGNFQRVLLNLANAVESLELATKELWGTSEHLENLFHHANAPIIVWDPQFRITRFNHAFEALTGRHADEVIGESVDILFPPAFVDSSMELVRKLLGGERWEAVEIGILHLDGSVRTVLWNSATVFAADGRTPLAVIGQGNDITERKQAELALRQSETKYRNLVENSLVGVYSTTVTGEILYANQASLKMFEFDSLGEMIADGAVARYQDPQDRETLIERLRTTGLVSGFEFRACTRKGRPLTVLLNATLSGDVLSGMVMDITQRKQAEEASREAAEQWQDTFDAIESSVAIIDRDLRIVSANAAMLKTFEGVQVAGEHCYTLLHGTDRPPESCQTCRVFDTGVGVHFEVCEAHLGNRWLDVSAYPVTSKDGGVRQLVHVHREIAAEKRLQQQFLQAQKLEAVGRLAGGVAHDFNNQLTVIGGLAQMALRQTGFPESLRQDLQEILSAAQRSADIVRQLLAFARRQTVNPQVLDLNDTVSGLLKMLGRLIGEDIDLAWLPGHSLWPVKVDPGQIDQLLANLVVNARDAITGVGTITIETGNAEFDETYCQTHAGFVSGQYVMLAVSDDGCGMDEQTRAQIFEPFFTTKGVGEGTGLGLSTVYGIVQQNHGFINVYSEPGQGTTFRIYLSRAAAAASVAPTAGGSADLPGGKETVLIVEDQGSLLKLAARTLEQLGYTVLTADTPGEALRLAEAHAGPIDLLLTDVVLPEMSGQELTERLASRRPGIKCLFMSGYTANAIAHHGVLDEGVHFLEKPFSIEALAAKLREALAGP
jgi:PAS domain S-box-containing protein